MQFETPWLQINPQLLESILLSLPSSIKQMKSKFKFANIEMYNKFTFYQQIRKKEESNQQESQDIFQNEQEEQEEQQQQQQQQKQQNNHQIEIKTIEKSKSKEIHQKKQLQISMQLSIILKKNYIHEFNKIANETNTTILVVPKKIKIISKQNGSISLIQDAFIQVAKIRQLIEVHKRVTSANEIYESKIYKKKLEQKQINLQKFNNSHLVWWQKSDKISKQIYKDIFKIYEKTKHKFYNLNDNFLKKQSFNDLKQNYDSYQNWQPKKYQKIQGKLKAKMFILELSNKANQLYEKQEYFIELAQNMNYLILHAQFLQHIEIRCKQLYQLYEEFAYFYLTFEKNSQQSIELNAQIQKLWVNQCQKEPNKWFYIVMEEFPQIICLSFHKSVDLRIENNSLFRLISSIVALNPNFRISIPVKKKDVPQEQKNIINYDNYEKILHISPKNKKVQKFIEIILNPLEIYQVGEIHSLTMTRQLNDTSLNIIQDESTVINNKSTTAILQEIQTPKQNQDIRLKNYNFHIEQNEAERAKKYEKNQIEKIERYFQSSNRKYEEILYQATCKQYSYLDQRFKIYNVRIPQNKHEEQQKANIQRNKEEEEKMEIITVFVKEQQMIKNIFTKNKLSIYLIENNNKNLKNDGFLININKSIIEPIKKQFEISANINKKQFEIIKFIKFMKNA